MASYLDKTGLTYFWSKIKTYVTNAVKVTGVKGAAENSYRTGNVNLTAENVKAVPIGGRLFTTNPFASEAHRQLYISKIDNAFFALDKRYSVTCTNDGATVTNVEQFFNGSYEHNLVHVEDDKSCVITIDFSSGTGQKFFGYPYGFVFVSFYNAQNPKTISGRVYNNYASQTVGWKDITFTQYDTATYVAEQKFYGLQTLEITIVGDGSNSSGYTSPVEVEFYATRPDPTEHNPMITKYTAQKLYYPLTAPSFIGDLTGNASTATNASKVNNHTVNSDVPSNAVFTDTTYSEATQSAAGLMSAADKTTLDNLSSGTVSDVKVNNTSVVSNGVANIPLSSSSVAGAMSASQYTKLNSLKYVLYGTTSTASSTAEKDVTVLGTTFSIGDGTILILSSTYTNNAANPKFKVHPSGASGTAYPVYYNNNAATGDKAGRSSRLEIFMFVSSKWHWIGWSYEQDTTYSLATTTASGLMSSADKTKLNGIDTGAEVNQNAFSTVTVGETDISAGTSTDAVEFVAGTNVTITPDATNKTVTIAATDTTYSAMSSSDIVTGTSETAMIATPKAIHDAIASMIDTALANMLEINDGE